ncbi:MAG: cellulase family glycosylhydrolase [Spirosomaceae bacterium]|nr:cellulase family glycosylhydrolase [Spirosomataceae bacterium]
MRYPIYLLIICLSLNTHAQLSVAELNKKLGRGINMGNMFEAPTETAWGNAFKDDYFKRIASLGFNHVRVPIRWDTPERTMLNAPYTLNATFLNRIKTVVDLARQENLMVIINMHHHDDLFINPDANKARFLSQWEQIATFFRGYDQNLIFEVLNEPHNNLNGAKWNVFFRDALAAIRKTNPTRAVLIAPQNYNALSGVRELEIPNDPNLILSIHYYDPFEFTHQGADWVGTNANAWLGTKWENTQQERDEVVNAFGYLVNLAKTKNIPVHIGEFGAYSKADLTSRVKWTNFLARWFETQGFSWAYWEFSAGFGIYDPATGRYLQPLVDALLKNPLPAAETIPTSGVYSSNIGNASDLWTVGVQGQARATSTFANGQGVINISEGSTETWHVQLVRRPVTLEKDKRYFVSFEIETNAPMSFSTYIGLDAAPYTAYTGYKGFTADKTFKGNYSFTMKEATDPKARIVFDLGKNKGTFILKSFKIEVEALPSVVTSTITVPEKVRVYPNPVQDFLKIETDAPIEKWALFDGAGRAVLEEKKPTTNQHHINAKPLPSGVYVLWIETSDGLVRQKIIKQ